MPSFSRRLNSWLGKRMFLVVLSGLFLGFFIPLSDSPFLRSLVVGLFAYMTLVTALGTSIREFVQVLRKPWIPLWILVLVHVAGPLLALLVGYVFYPDDLYTRMGFLVGASIPIGVTSIIWTSMVGGRVSIALVAVTLDTFVVPLVLPLFFHVAVGQSVSIDYFDMVYGLLKMVTIPSIVGMLLNEWTHGRVKTFAEGIGGAVSKLGLFVVIFINSAMVMPQIDWNLSMVKMLLVALSIVASGFFIGYLGSLFLKDRSGSMMITLMHNVGIRNNSCGLVIALSFFPPAVAVPITLSILYQQPVATLVSYFYRRYEKNRVALVQKAA